MRDQVISSLYAPHVVMTRDGNRVIIQAREKKAATETVNTPLGKTKRRKGFDGAREKFLQELYKDECAYVDYFAERDEYELYEGRNERDQLGILARAMRWAEFYHVSIDQSVIDYRLSLECEIDRIDEEKRRREDEERERWIAGQEGREANDPIIHKGMRRSLLVQDLRNGTFEVKDKADRLVFEMWYEGKL